MVTLQDFFRLVQTIAEMSGAYVSITDSDGYRIKTFNAEGREMGELKGVCYPLAKKAGESGEIQVGNSQIVKGGEAFAIPLGEYVIAASYYNKQKRELDLYNSLLEALPFIARVAGGEAIIFDKEGKRTASIDPDGSSNKQNVGIVSDEAKQAMEQQKTVIGGSYSVQGASAVRIPITDKFGFGFNNKSRVLKEHRMAKEVKKHQYARYSFSDIVGESGAIIKVKGIAEVLAAGRSSILITGETGTGKEMFAQAIHNASERCQKPFVAINCAALPASIIESFLFGYEGGSFTGAKKEGQIGSFEQANGGTIFLDEINEMGYDLQSKFLRVLQEQEVTRIGGVKPIKIDVRVIACTNKNLRKLIKQGKFREDLFYRLNVIELEIPPLRERIEDIPLLVEAFINRFNNIQGKYIYGVTNETMQILMAHSWPGNIRELQNYIEYAVNMVRRGDYYITPEYLPVAFRKKMNGSTDDNSTSTLNVILQKAEKDAIYKALQISNGVKNEAAKMLGISTVTLWRKIKEYDINT